MIFEELDLIGQKINQEKNSGRIERDGKNFNPERMEEKQIGMIAQEVEKVLPELVSEDPDGFLSVNYANLVSVLVEANKEQQKLIEDLQERVKKLETK